MATQSKKINYFARNFADVRTELVNFIKLYYPEVFSDFNDASVGMMLLELNAAVGDMLSYHTDRMFITPWVTANTANVTLGQIEAYRTWTNHRFNATNRLGQ